MKIIEWWKTKQIDQVLWIIFLELFYDSIKTSFKVLFYMHILFEYQMAIKVYIMKDWPWTWKIKYCHGHLQFKYNKLKN